MKVSQIATPFVKLQTQNVTNPVKQQNNKFNLQGPDRDVFEKSVKKEYSNEDAMALMREELKDAMSEKELNSYIKMLEEACKKLEIEHKDLPINEEHSGNLTPVQRAQLFAEMKYDSLSPLFE